MRVDFGALTVVLGRNNSGKSTVIQALLLLKQTLELTRVETPLSLEGYVNAINLRELTSGWPEEDSNSIVLGPVFSLEWEATVDIQRALLESRSPDIATLMDKAKLPWLAQVVDIPQQLYTKIDLHYAEFRGKVILKSIELRSARSKRFTPRITQAWVKLERAGDGKYECAWNGYAKKKIDVDIHHFIPGLSIDRRNVGPRDGQRSLANAFNVLFAQPLEALEGLLKGFSYLSSARGLPPPFYTPTSSLGDELGTSGEFSAQMLYAHRDEPVHYLLPSFENINGPFVFKEQPLVEAVNEVLAGLGIDTPLSIQEIQKAGFRLLFGNATLFHVGRGLTYLLPIVQLGLFSDPEAFKLFGKDEQAYGSVTARLCAFEEPESHLHPKVQVRLATWFVALARASRQVVVETHSDHLVRCLRALSAQAVCGSEIESWLTSEVEIVSVDQTLGITSVESGKLDASGGTQVWPKDFMDAAIEGEEAIYFASMNKTRMMEEEDLEIDHRDEDEPSASS